MVFEHNSYKNYLRAVLVERVQKNSKYSLRAFAKNLGVAPSTLSEVLSGRKNISITAAHNFSRKLGLSARESGYFTLLVQFESSADPQIRSSLEEQLNRFRPQNRNSPPHHDLSLDAFRAIADWYHLAILQLTFLDFEMTPENIARALGIKKLEAKTALERLERLKMIQRDACGKWHKITERWVAQSNVPNSALRSFHAQMLKKALDSLETQTPQEKIVGSETLAFNSDQIVEASQIIEQCFERVVALSKSPSPDSVYHLGIQFFRIFKNKKEIRHEN